jgi:hypothetical protein
MTEQDKCNEYNAEPVYYCANCYSLKIAYEDTLDLDCCMDCGSSNIKTTSIENWEALYKRRYGKPFVTKQADYRNHPIYKLSNSDLMVKVAESPEWKKIVYELYPHFPSFLRREDAIMLFFDKLITDNKVDDLKLILIDKFNNDRYYGKK